jgi:DNA-binding SARP family transcriptional activator/tetratricopeptide (TPR) repeat protein
VESPLALYLLGPPRIERDGVPVKLDRRKAIALVAYLAVTGQSHRRDSLVNLLWPEYDSSRGRAALRRTLYALRTALGSGGLAVDRDQIGLDSSTAPWVDVDQFHQRLAACETHGHPRSEVCRTCADSLTGAVDLVHGDFMGGFGLKDSVNFDDWQLLQAQLLRRELDTALRRLVRWHSTQREFEPAVSYARRRLVLDPLDEQAHRQLMRLYVWSGRRSTALRQYQECAASLDGQLGVSPQEATTQLFQEIQEGRAPPAPDERRAQDSFAPPEPLYEPPPFLEQEVPIEKPLFVARERELAQLDQHLQAALDGRGKVVFVTGEAGAGKTAIIQEFAWRAQDSQPSLVIAAGHSNAHTGVGDPYLPFREILGLLTGDVEAQWAAGAMSREQACQLWSTLPLAAQALVETSPDLIHTFILGTTLLRRARTVAPGGATWLTHLEELVEQKPVTRLGVAGPQQNDLFEQYTRILQVLAQQGPVILVLDDLQWADLGSISLLFHLGRQLTGNRILVVGAYRPEEVALGRVDPRTGSGQRERHPLEAVVNELQRDLGDITVNLGQDEGQKFIEALLQSEPNRLGDAFKEMLYRQTQGHPLFTIELLRGLQEQQDLVKDQEGYWIEGTALDWERLPARVEAVIAERIGRLTQPLRAALRVASVTAEVVARVRGNDEQQLLGDLSRDLDKRHRLIRAESIQRIAGQLVSRYRFRHGLFQRYLYGSLDQVERTHLHDQVGTALEELFGVQEESAATADIMEIAPQLARHFQQARNAQKAIHYLHQAGERSVQLCAYGEATAHLTEGLALLASQLDYPDRARQELALQLTLGMAQVGIMGYVPEARPAYAKARDLARRLGETFELCRAAGELALFHYVWAEHQSARELAEETLFLAQQTKKPLLVAMGHSYLGFVLFALGEYKSAQDHFQQVIDFYSPRQHHRTFVALRGSDFGVSALAYDACCLWCLGFPDQGAKRSEEALALAHELGHPITLADGLAYAGCLFNEMRQDAHAFTASAEELKWLATEKLGGWQGTAIWYSGGALALQGRLEDGIVEMRKGMEHQWYGNERCYRTGSLCSIAKAQGKVGRPEEGLSTLTEALAQVRTADERYTEAEIYRVKGDLLLAQGHETEAETNLHEAIGVARRQQAKSWELRATTSLARLWRTQGRADEAREALAEVYGWFSEGFDTPDLKEAKALLDELS